MRLIRIFTTARRALPRILPLFRDARVPFWLKAGAVALALLIVSPVDIFGDIPILGFFDDAVLLALALNAFVRFAEGFVLREAVPVRTVRAERNASPAHLVRAALRP